MRTELEIRTEVLMGLRPNVEDVRTLIGIIDELRTAARDVYDYPSPETRRALASLLKVAS